MTVLILAALIWWAVGLAGFAYWWTHDDDLTLWALIFGAIVGGPMGPFAWAVGKTIHDPGAPVVIIRKRER